MAEEEELPDETLEEKLIIEEEPRELTKEEILEQQEQEAREKKDIFVKKAGEITDKEASIIITDESHGFCNALKRFLLKNDHVLFASYKKEFGVDPTMYINTDGELKALDALLDGSDRLYVELQELEKECTKAIKAAK